MKYRDRRGGTTPIVNIDVERQERQWLFSITDNGIGIAQNYLEEIFGCFKRLHGQGEYPGSGVGLATCKKIVDGHGGRIWATSTPGFGSTFYFLLPGDFPADELAPALSSADGRAN